MICDQLGRSYNETKSGRLSRHLHITLVNVDIDGNYQKSTIEQMYTVMQELFSGIILVISTQTHREIDTVNSTITA